MKTLNVIGCGKVGQTLARLATRCGAVKLLGVLNRSLESSRCAVEFVGSGQPVEDYWQLQPSDLVMISTPDEAIEGCCRKLSETGLVREGVIVFHCSGALASTVLEPARRCGAQIAGVHPVRSFADPAVAVETFAGTFCALEGEPAACQVLRDVLERLGAITFLIDPQGKTIYHAATVMVSNYLVALLEIGLRCFQQAGVPRDKALEVMKPLVLGTVENVLKLGPTRALTGPIARGEASLVARQAEALGQWDAHVQGLYKALGRVAMELSAAQGTASPEALAEISEMLRSG